TFGRGDREVCRRSRSPGAGREKDYYIQRQLGAFGRSTDRGPETCGESQTSQVSDACGRGGFGPWVSKQRLVVPGGKMDCWTMRKNCAGVYPVGCLSRGLLALLACCTLTAPAQTTSQSKNPSFSIPATHLLGFENAKGNCTGTLTIQDQLLQFQQAGNPEAQVAITSIRDVFLGGESKQVGGLPMTLGKTAAPFGGGRVVSLFAHKNYDI